MPWRILVHPEFAVELELLPDAVQADIAALAEILRMAGPAMKRPRSDTLKGSRYPNMKELRFEADDGVWRVAYAFDPRRDAVLLCAADKSGVAQRRFYKLLIGKADRRFAQHLALLS